MYFLSVSCNVPFVGVPFNAPVQCSCPVYLLRFIIVFILKVPFNAMFNVHCNATSNVPAYVPSYVRLSVSF